MTLRQALQLIEGNEGIEIREAYKYTVKDVMIRDRKHELVKALESSTKKYLLDREVKFIESGWSKEWSWIRIVVNHYTY